MDKLDSEYEIENGHLRVPFSCQLSRFEEFTSIKYQSIIFSFKSSGSRCNICNEKYGVKYELLD
jgi:hypothetical protein